MKSIHKNKIKHERKEYFCFWTSSGTLFLFSVPVLMKDFGTAIKHSDDTGDRKFVSCSFGQSACSPDVLVAVCETEQNGNSGINNCIC